MRQIWLIAWRGFVQHATSRAFLFGLLLLPLYMVIGGILPTASTSQLAALGGPIRNFAVIDKTGVMIPAIDAALDRDVTARGLRTLAAYAEENADEERLRKGNPDCRGQGWHHPSLRRIAALPQTECATIRATVPSILPHRAS
jgi:ABC-type Na+ efflux pump permease subunit